MYKTKKFYLRIVLLEWKKLGPFVKPKELARAVYIDQPAQLETMFRMIDDYAKRNKVGMYKSDKTILERERNTE